MKTMNHVSLNAIAKFSKRNRKMLMQTRKFAKSADSKKSSKAVIEIQIKISRESNVIKVM